MLKKLGRTSRSSQDQARQNAPPGQYVTKKFPVMTFGPTPEIALDEWRFRVFGLAEEKVTLDWKEFTRLEKTRVDAELHCVTQWSRLENTWEGVTFNELMGLIRAMAEARYVMVHCYGGYTANLALDVLLDADVLFAYGHYGSPLEREHGGPLRLVVPKRYGWKSAKWVNGLEFMAEDRPGFWEVRGYHMEADPWKEERFGNTPG